MDGFLKEDMIGRVRNGMSMEQIDAMITRQMRVIDEDYERCKKYEDPGYNGDSLELKGTFEKQTTEDGTQFVGHTNVAQEDKIEVQQGQEVQIDGPQCEQSNENKSKESEDEGEDEEEEDNSCMQDYYQPLGEEDQGLSEEEDNQEWGEFQELPVEKDPRKKSIDYDKIRQIMSSFTLQPPAWAAEQAQCLLAGEK